MTCRRSKPSNQKPYGLLNLLGVPAGPWDAIGIDFVGQLPESKDRDGSYDMITVQPLSALAPIFDVLTSFCLSLFIPLQILTFTASVDSVSS
ncbi:hypothetical protein AMATHDRAFT_70081, partial [Amanita thiersii Skay4041]